MSVGLMIRLNAARKLASDVGASSSVTGSAQPGAGPEERPRRRDPPVPLPPIPPRRRTNHRDRRRMAGKPAGSRDHAVRPASTGRGRVVSMDDELGRFNVTGGARHRASGRLPCRSPAGSSPRNARRPGRGPGGPGPSSPASLAMHSSAVSTQTASGCRIKNALGAVGVVVEKEDRGGFTSDGESGVDRLQADQLRLASAGPSFRLSPSAFELPAGIFRGSAGSSRSSCLSRGNLAVTRISSSRNELRVECRLRKRPLRDHGGNPRPR